MVGSDPANSGIAHFLPKRGSEQKLRSQLELEVGPTVLRQMPKLTIAAPIKKRSTLQPGNSRPEHLPLVNVVAEFRL